MSSYWSKYICDSYGPKASHRLERPHSLAYEISRKDLRLHHVCLPERQIGAFSQAGIYAMFPSLASVAGEITVD